MVEALIERGIRLFYGLDRDTALDMFQAGLLDLQLVRIDRGEGLEEIRLNNHLIGWYQQTIFDIRDNEVKPYKESFKAGVAGLLTA